MPCSAACVLELQRFWQCYVNHVVLSQRELSLCLPLRRMLPTSDIMPHPLCMALAKYFRDPSPLVPKMVPRKRAIIKLSRHTWHLVPSLLLKDPAHMASTQRVAIMSLSSPTRL
eukprot:EG_transcript_49674